jgi:alpha-L-rhamnosidase
MPMSRRRFLQISASATALGAAGLDASQQTAAAAASLSQSKPLTQSNLAVSGLRVDYLTNPLGIDDTQPWLSWLLTSAQQNQVQAAYQIQAASTASLLAAGTPDLWDTGQVTSAASFNIPYAGTALTSRKQVYWQVRAWDTSGNPSAWSAAAAWEMGLLTPADWSASWISNPGTGALPLFAKQFSLAKTVSSARLYITGVGVYEASINGTAAGDGLPEASDLHHLRRGRPPPGGRQRARRPARKRDRQHHLQLALQQVHRHHGHAPVLRPARGHLQRRHHGADRL